MKTGIYITTRNRLPLLEFTLSYFDKFCEKDTLINIIDDCSNTPINLPEFNNIRTIVHRFEVNIGIAKAKNYCLWLAKENKDDYIFMFEDDCFPISYGWENFFIDAHLKSGQHYFHCGFPINHPKFLHYKIEKRIKCYKTEPTACFLFLTKEVIDKVGGFSLKYEKYGVEHVQYTERVFLSKLNTISAVITPFDSDKYLYSIDHQNTIPLPFDLSMYSSMPDIEKKLYSDRNLKIYQEDVKNLKIYEPIIF